MIDNIVITVKTLDESSSGNYLRWLTTFENTTSSFPVMGPTHLRPIFDHSPIMGHCFLTGELIAIKPKEVDDMFVILWCKQGYFCHLEVQPYSKP